MFTDTLTLANGVEIPQMALGTWLVDDSIVAQAVRDAVKIGYRHIDTAQVDFTISDEDMEILENMERITDYGASSGFPVFGGKI